MCLTNVWAVKHDGLTANVYSIEPDTTKRNKKKKLLIQHIHNSDQPSLPSRSFAAALTFKAAYACA